MTALPLTRRVPQVGPPPPLRLPPVVERRLPTGLRVVAVRRPSVPRVEVRLRVGAGHVHDPSGVRSRVLPEAILAGTPALGALEIARELQRMGASASARATPDDLVLQASVLAPNLGPLLELVAEVVVNASFPEEEVAVARGQVAQELSIQRSQPSTVAWEHLTRLLYPRHPYGRGLPDPEAVRGASARSLRAYHAGRVVPRGGVLVLVGDLQPGAAVERAWAAFRRWRRSPRGPRPSPPPPPEAGPAVLVDRPGAVQTTIRIGGPAPSRSHPDYFAASLAITAYGGYISSRMVENIRERRGYSYSPRSVKEHARLASSLVVAADVGTEVTAPALVEIRYELERMVAAPLEPAELEAARRYLTGRLAHQVQTQAGLADQLDGLAAAGVGAGWLRDFARNLARVGVEDVREAAARYLAPRGLRTVLVGDAGRVARELEPLGPLQVVAR